MHESKAAVTSTSYNNGKEERNEIKSAIVIRMCQRKCACRYVRLCQNVVRLPLSNIDSNLLLRGVEKRKRERECVWLDLGESSLLSPFNSSVGVYVPCYVFVSFRWPEMKEDYSIMMRWGDFICSRQYENQVVAQQSNKQERRRRQQRHELPLFKHKRSYKHKNTHNHIRIDVEIYI